MSKKRASTQTKTDRRSNGWPSQASSNVSASEPDGKPPEARSLPSWLSRAADGSWILRVKAVPGASRDEITGVLDGRLKVRVSAPPEGGKANKAICMLIAKKLGVSTRLVAIVTGATSATKTVRIEDQTIPVQVVQRLADGA